VNFEQKSRDCREIIDILSVDERKKADRFVFEWDRNRYVKRRAILRTILGHYLTLQPQDVTFRYNRYGKPRLKTKSPFFNISSSFNWAVYAVAYVRRVGVDIEKIRAFGEMGLIARRLFSAAEYEHFNSVTENKKQGLFFKYWTRKEAIIKAIGRGLSIPLDTFDVSINADEPVRQVEMRAGKGKIFRWIIYDLDLPGFASAVAAEGPVSPTLRVIDFRVS
jgi:4'-phosphopantetheinyl transferase